MTDTDIRVYPTGQLINNTHPNPRIPTHPGHIAPTPTGHVWIAYTTPTQGGTTDTASNALNAVIDAWLEQVHA